MCGKYQPFLHQKTNSWPRYHYPTVFDESAPSCIQIRFLAWHRKKSRQMGPLTLTLTFILEVKFFCFKVFPFIHSNWCSCRICKTSFKFCSSVQFPILHHYFRSDSDVLHSHSWGNVRQCRERRATMCNYGNNNWQYSSLMKHRCDEASDTRKEKNHRLQQWSFRI